MRHRVFGKKLNRDIKERKALFKSLIRGLILHGSIKTTLARAKAVIRIGDKLVTTAKANTRGARTDLVSFLTHSKVINKFTKEIVPLFKDKHGGYLSLVKLGNRVGDYSSQAILKWSILPAEMKVALRKDVKKLVSVKEKVKLEKKV